MPVEGLIYRLLKGSPLLASEMDGNLEALANAFGALEGYLGQILNSDGTLKDDSVDTDAIKDRAVTEKKLAFNAIHYAVDTGAANAVAVAFSPAATAYDTGMCLFVKVAANNTGASTLAVDGMAVQPIKKYASGGIADLVANDMIAGMIYCFIYDGTNFVILNPTTSAGVGQSVYAADTDATANAIVATYVPAISSYTDGLMLAVKVQTANTGATTFNAGAGAKKLLKLKGTELVAGDLLNGMIIEVRYDTAGDGGNGAWQLLTPIANTGAGATVGTTTTVAAPGSGGTQAFTHGLAAVPKMVRAVLVNLADGNWPIGTEVDVLSVGDGAGAVIGAVWADATYITVYLPPTPVIGGVSTDYTGMLGTIWNLKVYYIA